MDNVLEVTMLGCYAVFAKPVNPLPQEPQLSIFYHLLDGQKIDAIMTKSVRVDLALLHLYKHFKYRTYTKLVEAYYQPNHL